METAVYDIDLHRSGAEIGITGQARQDIRSGSSAAWRREQLPSLQEEAYQLFKQVDGSLNTIPTLAADLHDLDIPLFRLFQRHFTEAIVETLETVVMLQTFFNTTTPELIHVTHADLPIVQLATQRADCVPHFNLIHDDVKPQTAVHHFGENIARHALYLPRIANLHRKKPSIGPRQAERRRLLFHPYSPNHLPSFMPLIEQMAARGDEVIVAGADSSTTRRGDVDPSPVQALNVPYFPFETAVSPFALLRAMQIGIIKATRAGQQIRKTENDPFDLPDEMWAIVQPLLTRLFESHLPKIILYLHAADALYYRLRPDLVIVTDETLPILGGVALRAAQRLNIRTLTMQHGLLLTDPMYFGETIADKFAIWGEHSRDFMMNHGCPARKLQVVGSTRFGHPTPALQPLDLCQALSLPPETRVLLFTTQTSGRDVSAVANQETLVALTTAVSTLPSTHLLIKPHPAQTEKEIAAMKTAVSASASVTIRRDLPLHAAMLAADLCITIFSTTGLEAFWLKRPLLMINLTDRPDLIPYGEGGAAIVVHEAGALLPALQRALDPADQVARAPARAQFVARYLGLLDGNAITRLMAVADHMMEENHG